MLIYIKIYFNVFLFSLIYFALGILFYSLTNGQPFQFDQSGFDKILDFIIKSEELNRINSYLEQADKKFFFFYCAIYF